MSELKWLSTTERLPMIYETVWIFFNNKKVVLGYLNYDPDGKENEKWYEMDEDEYGWTKWWMPIKKPKKPLKENICQQ
jgi:hypothetical protein